MWQKAETAPKDGTRVLATGGVYHGAIFEAAYAPSEFKPDEPWVNAINGHRLPEHCIHYWAPRPTTPTE